MSTHTLAVGPNPQIEIKHVGGDLSIKGWGRAELEAKGDDRHPAEIQGGQVAVSSGGDLELSIPEHARLQISFVGGDLELADLKGSIELSFVGGDAHLQDLAGEVTLVGLVGGEMQMENVTKLSMEAHPGGATAELSAKIQRKVQEATRRADRKLRAVEKQIRVAEVKMQHAERNSHHHGHPIPPRPPVPPRGPSGRSIYYGFDPPGSVEPREPVSDEERMAILKMLQEKKITSEQADQLLAALEGGES